MRRAKHHSGGAADLDGLINVGPHAVGVEIGGELAAEVLDLLPVAVVLVEPGGKILSMNRAAEAMGRARDGLTLAASGVTADRHDENARLAQSIRGALAPSGITITRPSGRIPYSVSVVPLRREHGALGHEHAVVGILIVDPDPDIQRTGELLHSLYDLTPAESRVALALVHGRSLEELARDQRISVHTARTHLKRIFSKTDTSSQRDLVRVLLLGPASH